MRQIFFLYISEFVGLQKSKTQLKSSKMLKFIIMMEFPRNFLYSFSDVPWYNTSVEWFGLKKIPFFSPRVLASRFSEF